MSQLLVASIGSYPRTGEDKDQQRYPRALGHFERKEISAHALRDVEQSVVQEIIREQLEAGLDEVSDGLIAWPDPISRFCRHLPAVRTAGLARYFDNNFYYRVPVITAKPRLQPPLSGPGYRFARDISNKPVRAVLTGPLTLARHTEASLKPYDRLQTRIELFTDIIAQEIDALASENAPVIQIDEPSLVGHPEDLPAVAAAYRRLANARGKAQLTLALYFGSSLSLIDALKDLPFNGWQIDLTFDGQAVLGKLGSAPAEIIIGCGVADGRSTRLETVEHVEATLSSFIAGRTAARTYLTPSCGLEFLPRQAAFAKLKRLSEIRHRLAGAPIGTPRG